jgi:hypothetical protein
MLAAPQAAGYMALFRCHKPKAKSQVIQMGAAFNRRLHGNSREAGRAGSNED